jgi:hypothetical protein
MSQRLPALATLELVSSGNLDATTQLWQVVQTLRLFGPQFAPVDLLLARGKREPVRLDCPADAAAVIADPRLRIATPEWTSISFGLATDRPGLYFDLGIEQEHVFKMHFRPGLITSVISPTDLVALFRALVRAFQPYWGAVEDVDNVDRLQGTTDPSKRYDPVKLAQQYPIVRADPKRIPQIIHWINYFGSEFVERLGGREHLLAGPVYLAEELTELGGIIWVLQEEPFDDHKKAHRARQCEATAYLRLEEIQQQYLLW